jgi:hypothetical protein
MTSYTQNLQTNLTNSMQDGELLAKTQIATAVDFLVRAQNLSVEQVRNIVNELLCEHRPKPTLRLVHRRRVILKPRPVPVAEAGN